jgi:hypothetical protein
VKTPSKSVNGKIPRDLDYATPLNCKQTFNHACNDFPADSARCFRWFIRFSAFLYYKPENDRQTELTYKGWRASTGNHQSLVLTRANNAGNP